MRGVILALAGLAYAGVGQACNVQFNVTLQTFGEGVSVELRGGVPGTSTVVRSTRSFGGSVNFAQLCPGSYFLAIGNGDSVSVTPVRNFVDDMIYSSRITIQRGAGNVSTKSRRSL